jgi:hypothetical protein
MHGSLLELILRLQVGAYCCSYDRPAGPAVCVRKAAYPLKQHMLNAIVCRTTGSRELQEVSCGCCQEVLHHQ